jgi:hypothetical protein
MKQMMFVSIPCSGCKRNLKLGKTEIEPNAPPSLLHKQLRQEGWKDFMTETCLLKECGVITSFGLDRTILLGSVETTSDGVEL